MREQERKKLEMMSLIDKMKKPNIMAKRYDWEALGKIFKKHKDLLDKQSINNIQSYNHE